MSLKASRLGIAKILQLMKDSTLKLEHSDKKRTNSRITVAACGGAMQSSGEGCSVWETMCGRHNGTDSGQITHHARGRIQ